MNRGPFSIASRLLAASMVVAVMAGCSTGSTGTSPGASASQPGGSSSAAPKRVSVGVIVPTLDAQFWTNYAAFMKQGADELGIDLTILNADNKPDQMASQLEDLVAKEVDGIIFTAYWNLGKKGLDDAKAANIPVIITDAYISDLNPQDAAAPNYLAFVGPSDESAGFQMAEALIAATTAGADGKKHIAVVDGTPGTSVAIDRHAGLDRSLKAHTDVVVDGTINGNFVRDTSQTAFESLYQGNPEIKGVWCANGGTATGVMTAIKNAGKAPGTDIMVVAMDLNPENVTAVKSGELLFDIGGHWLQGGFALVMMYDYLNGLPITAEQANVKLELLPLTKDKVAQFEKDFPNGVPAYSFKEHSRVYTPSALPATFELKYTQ